jgi:hypothetical protein
MGVEIPRRGPKIFISYAFSNRNIAALEADLLHRGWRPTVVQATTLLGAPSLAAAIRALIEDSDYVVPLVDEAASRSAWVLEEIRIARELDVPLIPVLEQGVTLTGVFRDIPCVTADMGLDAVADRIQRDYVPIDVDASYPAHMRSDCWVDYIRHDRPPLVDASLALSRRLAAVADALIGSGHEQMSRQTRRQWDRFNRRLVQFQAVLPAYRAVAWTLLGRYSEPEQSSLASWNALSRLFIGDSLVDFIETHPPERHAEWGELRQGAAAVVREWEAVREADPSIRLWLWAVGRRQLPVDRWSEDGDSPLGDWRLVTARLHDGTSHRLILPDQKVIASGLRLKEPPRRFLESWHWLDFVLPQLAYAGASLRADLGRDMLTELENA